MKQSYLEADERGQTQILFFVRALILVATLGLGLLAGPINRVEAQSPTLKVTITTPLEDETFYAGAYSLVYSIDVAGYVATSNPEPSLVQVRLDVLSEGQVVKTATMRLHNDGSFAFGMTVNPDAPAGQFSADQRNCDACHYLADILLPRGQVTLRITAREPNGNQATAERDIFVDLAGHAMVPVKIASVENPQLAIANIPVYGSARMYLWRTRIGLATTDATGQARIEVEALSQSSTRYVVNVPPVVVNGVLYESVESKQVVVQPGQAQSAPVTLLVRSRRGQLSGTIHGASDAPLTVHAIDENTGVSFTTQSRANTFAFSDLPVAAYLIALDPNELAARSLQANASQIDLTTAPLAQSVITLTASSASPRTVRGTIRTTRDEPVPFAWIAIESNTARTDPVTGEFAVFDVPTNAQTMRVIAPGFWSQSVAIKNDAPVSITLTPRPELRSIAWGSGAMMIPPETVTESIGGRLILTQGVMWGKGTGTFSLQSADATIALDSARVAIERQPDRAWLYVMEGKANVAFDASRQTTVNAGQMVVIDSRLKNPSAVSSDPIAIRTLNPMLTVLSDFAIQPTLGAQASELFAQFGISIAQLVTFVTYLFIILALVGAPFLVWRIWSRVDRQNHPTG
jgi:hypothetical protein